jgi:hypothetical protein
MSITRSHLIREVHLIVLSLALHHQDELDSLRLYEQILDKVAADAHT